MRNPAVYNKGSGHPAHKHGESRPSTTEYRVWKNMKDRCTNPNHPQYDDYGGRGIEVCDRWNDYTNFLEDVGRKPSPELSIDRIDNEKGYEPGNVRWASRIEQNNNRRVRCDIDVIAKKLAEGRARARLLRAEKARE